MVATARQANLRMIWEKGDELVLMPLITRLCAGWLYLPAVAPWERCLLCDAPSSTASASRPRSCSLQRQPLGLFEQRAGRRKPGVIRAFPME
jgi:hypothetical protein